MIGKIKFKDILNELSKRELKLANLEKENAELKEKLKPENCLKLLAKGGYIKFTSEQLSKAKVALRNVIDYLGQFCGVTMFEKEAKERAKDYTDNAKRQVAYECGFLDGVDLGYNKAKEEAKDIINELLMNGYDENTRAKAFDFLYPNKEE